MNNRRSLCLITCLFFLTGIQPSLAQQTGGGDRQSAVERIERAYAEGNLSLDDKIRYHAYALRNPRKLPGEFQGGGALPEKCGTPLQMEFYRKRDRLSPATIAEVESLVNPSSLQACEPEPNISPSTYSSSSGRFHIRYYTSGSHAVPPADEDGSGTPDYVEWVAAAADSSWNHEVGTLGYTDFIRGESQPYELNICNLEFYYGETVSEESTTFIRIENDFSENFPPNTDPEGDRKGAVKATTAHEIKHASQFAATGWSGETDDWAEMDATLMEEVVYDNVNDYYNYIRSDESIFLNPQRSFYPGSYYQVTWALFFEEKYGPRFWPGVWDIIVADPQITMVNALAEALGSGELFIRDYIESHLWHYASGNYAHPDYGFEERGEYPDPAVEVTSSFYTDDFAVPRTTPNPQLAEFSANYYEILSGSENGGDVAIEIPQAGEFVGIGLIAYFRDGTAETAVYTFPGSPASVESTGWSWENIDRLGLILANSDTGAASDPVVVEVGSSSFETVTLSQNYPNPFHPETRIRFTLDEPAHVQLRVYDIGGRLIRTLYDRELTPGFYEPAFSGEDLASGVYIYRLVTGDDTFVKKMTLIK